MFFVDALSTMRLVEPNPDHRKLVDVRQQLPPQWEAWAEQRGLNPTATAIAQAAGLATSTVTRLIAGRYSSTASINAIAAALQIKPDLVAEQAGVHIHEDLGMWDPPKEAHQLGGAERDVLNRLIGVLAKGDEHADRRSKAKKSDYDLAAYGGHGDPEDELPPEALSQRDAGEENQDS